MCGKGSNSTTEQSSQTTAPTPEVAQAYSGLLNQAQSTAATPYQSYGGQMVAGFNPTQQSAFGQISDLSQQYLPQALNYAQQGAGGINPGQISQYMNPFQQQVIQATQANIGETNALQQQQVMGNAISRGAWGGDRAGIAQSELARQQALASNQTMAGLNSANYQQALGAAQADRSAAAQGAYSMGNLQSSALQGIGAQMGAGNQQQQLAQSQLNVPYQQFLEQRGYPFQVAQWLAGLTTGVGSQMGGTSTGSKVTTAPPPSVLGQLGGIGLAGVGMIGGTGGFGASGWLRSMFSKDGGRIPYAEGGEVMPYGGAASLGIPGIAISRGAGPPRPQGIGGGGAQPAPSANPSLDRMMSSAIDLAGKMKGTLGPQQPLDLSPPGAGQPPSMGISPQAGFGDGPMYHRGGGIRGYDGGGMIPVLPTMGSGSIAPLGFQAQENDTLEPVRGGIFGGLNFKPMGWPEAADSAAPAPMSFAGPDVRPAGEFNEIDAQAGMPPQQPGIGLPFAGDQTSGLNPSGGIAPSAPSQGADTGTSIWPAVMAAGLGMMASKSHYLGQAIGEGGLQGLQTYAQQKQAGLAEKRQQEDVALRKQNAEIAAKRLAQDTEKFFKQHTLETEKFSEAKRQHEAQEAKGVSLPAGGTMVNPRTGEVIARNADSSLEPDTITDIADRYLAGDKSAIQNIGRGAQGAVDLRAIQNRIYSRAREANLSPEEIGTRMADFGGRTAAMRTLGTKGANIEYASNTANRAIDIAEEAMKKLPRTQFLPLNRMIQMVESNTSSPEQAAAVAATNTLVNEYARVVSPTGVPTEGTRSHAREMLNTAQNQPAYNAVLAMMRKEIASAKAAYLQTRKEFLSQSPNDLKRDAAEPAHGAAPAAPASGPPAAAKRVRQNGHIFELQPDGSYKAVD